MPAQDGLDDCVIALEPLVQRSGIRWMQHSATGVDAQQQTVQLDDGSSLHFDWLSVNTGPVQDRKRIEQNLPGASEHALFLRPLEAFSALWPRVKKMGDERALRVAVIGGGAGGIELALAVRHRLPSCAVTLVCGDTPPGSNYPLKVQQRLLSVLKQRGVTVLQDWAVAVKPGAVQLGCGADLACDVPLLATGAQAPPWQTAVATSPVEVAEITERLLVGHAAVAVKIHSRDISHKSDVGGVRLNLGHAAEAQTAATDMLAHVRSLSPMARMDGFTVSPMVKRRNAHELIVGMSVDPTFGPLILFGAGGTAVEVMQDTALALPPLDMQLARDVIRHTRIHRLLEGYRDRASADQNVIADGLVRVGQLIADHPDIVEIDINPLLADESGVIALDARIAILRPTDPPRTAMAIQPYPVAWEKSLQLDGVGDVLLRPIRPEDEALYVEFMAHVAPADHRLRFFSDKQALSHRLLARLTQIDYARDMAFVALDGASGRLLGVARYSADPDRQRAEYAVLVRSDLKGHGLGWALMRHLIDHAKATGVGHLSGAVLAENATMLRMCRELGFAVVSSESDGALCDVELNVAGQGP